jgi:hypothetical protein
LQAFDGLTKCGVNEGAQLLQKAMDMFEPYGGYTRDRDVRNDRIDLLEAKPSAQPEGAFRKVSNAFQDSREPMLGLALKRVMEAYKREGVDISQYRKVAVNSVLGPTINGFYGKARRLSTTSTDYLARSGW